MIIYIAICILILLLSPLGLFPKVHWDSDRSENGWAHIDMHKTGYYVATNQSKRGVYAQERVENWITWFVFLTPSIFLSLLATLFISPIAGYIAIVVGLLIGLIYKNSTAFTKQVEFIGHTVESVVSVKDGYSYDTYARDEAQRTLGNTINYPFFKGMTLDDMLLSMKKRVPLAKFLAAIQTIPLNQMKK